MMRAMATRDLAALAQRRAQLRDRYLQPAPARPASTGGGVHHLALICAEPERTIRFYQDVLGFPLVELFENRDYEGSSHFFFDIGNGNMLAFFDFPGLGLEPVLEGLGAFLAISAVVICTPGQDTALTIKNTLAGGRRGGVATALGVSLGQAAWTIAASAGVVAVLRSSQPAFAALKLAGAAYLVFLGVQALRHALAGRGTTVDGLVGPRVAPRAALRQGVVSNLANPKMAAFFTSLLPQFAPEGEGAFAALLALGLLFCTLTFVWLALYSVAVARARALLERSGARRALEAVTGTVLVALGLRLGADAR